MPNTNCLEHFKCPKCGFEDKFSIDGSTLFVVTDEGTEDHSDIEWKDGGTVICHGCNFVGALEDFYKPPRDIEDIMSADVTLKVKDWVEVYYAIDTKLANIENGLYDDMEDDKDIDVWKQQLERAKDRFEEWFKEVRIVY